jgi:dephospho-CoA kinase
MLLVGLTGSLGAGKSTVARALAARGAAVIDTDQVARDVLAPGSDGARAVAERFGPTVVGPGASLDRRALARLVFSDPAQRLALEAITHPLVRQEVGRRLAATDRAVVVLEIPLLDGRRRQEYNLDLVVVVDAPEETAVHRAVLRGMPESDARARIAAQPSDDERRAIADRVVLNTGSLDALERGVDELWAWLEQALQ